MKTFISIFIIAYISLCSWAGQPPQQNVVDQYVSLAISNNVDKLKGQGPVSCQYDIMINVYGKDPTYIAYGKNIEEASQRLALLCIKERCQQIGLWMNSGLSDLDNISNSDFIEFLKSQGYNEEEIAIRLQKKQIDDRSSLKQLTCQNSIPMARMVVFDSCFVQPVKCQTK